MLVYQRVSRDISHQLYFDEHCLFFHLLILPSIELKTMTFPPALPPWQAEAQLIMALHTFCLEPYAIWEVPLAAMKHE